MTSTIVGIARTLAGQFRDRITDAVLSAMLENVILEYETHSIEILDGEGEATRGSRRKRYAVRWHAADHFPDERISLGPTGKLKSLNVEKPAGLNYAFVEGKLDQPYCVFRVRAPAMRPTYLFRRRLCVDLLVRYEADRVFTRDSPPESLSWIKRIPNGKPMAERIDFELVLPKDHPMLNIPSVYKLNDLASTEAAITDLGLDKSNTWQRLPEPSIDSHIIFDESLDHVCWTIHPTRRNTAYMIRWDWWR